MTAAFFVGTYARSGGAGLVPLAVDSAGNWSLGQPYPHATNASFGCHSPGHNLHYFVDERDEGRLRVFRRDAGAWQPVISVPTCGGLPCYAALDREERWLAVANYGSGSVALFDLDACRLPHDPKLFANKGSGPVADRQEGPHAHCANFAPDGKWLFGTDLGTDEVLAWPFDPAVGVTGDHRVALRLPPGSGPRHLVFHPREPVAFLITELTSALMVLDVEDGRMKVREQGSTLPDGFEGENLGGHLALSAAGDRVYVTNRGHDSLAVFAWDGGLSPLQHIASGGASPRQFVLVRDRLLVAHEQGQSVGIFAIDRDGLLVPEARVDVSGAAFVMALEERQ